MIKCRLVTIGGGIMRVIAGDKKGHRLKAVPGKTSRPTTDRIREAVFQILGPYFPGGSCLDLFAGSGALGIEALSRGLERAVFVDKNAKAIETIRHNVKSLRLEEKAEIVRTTAQHALQEAERRGMQFDLILIDPPYRTGAYESYLHTLRSRKLLNENAFIYCEHDLHASMPDDIEHLSITKQVNYGGAIGVTIYQWKQANE